MTTPTTLEIITLPRDLKRAAATLEEKEARYLVDSYYQIQEFRKATTNQVRSLGADEEPHETLTFFSAQFETLEKQIKSALDTYSASQPLGEWARSIVGIGPVIAAGLLAHIDMNKAPTVGHIWRFAGLDPTVTWNKGEKRPWNADLKTLCWKIGDSFVKFSNNDNCFYGHIYRNRKAFELQRDGAVREVPEAGFYKLNSPVIGTDGVVRQSDVAVEAIQIGDKWFVGGNAITAANTLKTRNIKDAELRKTYESGHMPAGRLDMRARRYATKLFIAHYHENGYKLVLGQEPPLPYPIAILGHKHQIPSP